MQVYCNDSPCAQLSGGFSSAGQMENGVGDQISSQILFSNSANPTHFPAVADYFFDLSVTANRRKFSNPTIRAGFIASNGAAVDPGAFGTLPVGVQPQLFFHQDAGDTNAADFVNNRGSTGGTYAYNGVIILEPDGYCTGPPAPLPPTPPGPTPPTPQPPPPLPEVIPHRVWVEALRPLFEVEDNLYDAWFVDGSDIPTSAQTIFNGTRFFGFNHQLGNTVSVWSGGLDCGDFLVQVGGYVDVPFGSAGGLYTAAYLDGLVAAGYDGVTNMVLLDGVTPIPAVVGKTYSSSGQIVRPASPADTGARNGPGQGKTRRNHMMTALLNGTQGISFGTDFQHVFPFQPALYVNGPVYPVTQLYSGVYWDTLDDTYTFDGMVCWTVGRPYPASVVNIGGFIQTSDR